MKFVPSAASAALLAGLAACAAPAAPDPSSASAEDATEARILVKLVRPSTDSSAIADRAAAAAGVPVRYLAATSAQWHALALRCGSVVACEAALQRLRADAASFEAVQRDERRRPATP